METAPGRKAYLTLGLLFAGTCALLLFTVDIRYLDRAGIRQDLPADLGELWKGAGILFCQNPECKRGWLQSELTPNEDGKYRCPRVLKNGVCKGEMATGSYDEYANLPSDTVIFKRQYRQQNHSVTVGVILSGRDRSSIHRPEICMPSQGNQIRNQHVIEVPLPEREPLNVMVLDLVREINGTPVAHSYFAYWFVGQGRETPYHWERMKWMATDRIFKNVSHQWAYVHVSGNRSSEFGNTDHHEEIRDVIAKLHPRILQEDM